MAGKEASHESFSDGTPEQMAAADQWFLLLGCTAYYPPYANSGLPSALAAAVASAT